MRLPRFGNHRSQRLRTYHGSVMPDRYRADFSHCWCFHKENRSVEGLWSRKSGVCGLVWVCVSTVNKIRFYFTRNSWSPRLRGLIVAPTNSPKPVCLDLEVWYAWAKIEDMDCDEAWLLSNVSFLDIFIPYHPYNINVVSNFSEKKNSWSKMPKWTFWVFRSSFFLEQFICFLPWCIKSKDIIANV